MKREAVSWKTNHPQKGLWTREGTSMSGPGAWACACLSVDLGLLIGHRHLTLRAERINAEFDHIAGF